MHKMAEKALPMERLVVDAKLAQEMFEDNRWFFLSKEGGAIGEEQ